ncbi:MAG: hypothetical protein SVM86_04125 [Candidatus Cloacimonadota bacterium]|nr:hypothetical protein [Candidatus Cloacimonadota bacterium]
MQWYICNVQAHPIIMAIIQFAILGTLGEAVSKWIINKKVSWPFDFKITLWKMIVWSILAIGIKYAFTGMSGFIKELVEHNLLPQSIITNNLGNAFAKSVVTNLQFGFFLVIFHRFLDNLPLKEKNWKNLDKGILCMIWFWIPAHTITFILPTDFQIGLAALWSVVLGIILGFFNRKK